MRLIPLVLLREDYRTKYWAEEHSCKGVQRLAGKSNCFQTHHRNDFLQNVLVLYRVPNQRKHGHLATFARTRGIPCWDLPEQTVNDWNHIGQSYPRGKGDVSCLAFRNEFTILVRIVWLFIGFHRRKKRRQEFIYFCILSLMPPDVQYKKKKSLLSSCFPLTFSSILRHLLNCYSVPDTEDRKMIRYSHFPGHTSSSHWKTDAVTIEIYTYCLGHRGNDIHY